MATAPGERTPTLTEDSSFVSLYRRFRPGTFASLRGQPHVVRALQHAVRDQRVGHAYLFSGPRGTGKTSTARILAKALNCANPLDGEPCGICASCVEIAKGTSLDVIELDAASNNGVDAMRDLITHASLGTPGTWKVYIVDEVHMLSNAAANALLKTLEEPPGHVVFVLATTDPQKVPPTIRSRTQHFEFRLLSADTLDSLLRDIRDEAGLELDDAAVGVAVRRGKGSARDALSALDQVAAIGEAAEVGPTLDALLAALGDEDATSVLVALGELFAAGFGPQQVAIDLVVELRQLFLSQLAPSLVDAEGPSSRALADRATAFGLRKIVRAIELVGHAQVDMRDAPDPGVIFEVALVKASRPDLDESTAALAERVHRLEQAIANGGGSATPVAGPPVASPTPAQPSAPPVARPSVGHDQTPSSASAPVPESMLGAAVSSPSPTPQASPTQPAKRSTIGALRKNTQSGNVASPPPVEAPPVPPVAAPQSEPAVVSTKAPEHPAKSGTFPDLAALVASWEDVRQSLPGLAKALYAAGHFVSVLEPTIEFALPNAAHRDRCVDARPQVEASIRLHFGVDAKLVLVVLEGAATPEAEAFDETPKEADGGHFEALAADAVPAPDHNAMVESKIFELFPGAEEVNE